MNKVEVLKVIGDVLREGCKLCYWGPSYSKENLILMEVEKIDKLLKEFEESVYEQAKEQTQETVGDWHKPL